MSVYYPDILIVFDNLYIDVEIDEPYVFEDGKPIHYVRKINDDYYYSTSYVDANRNYEFTVYLGFEVVIFSEEQVFRHTDECVEFIKRMITCIKNAEPDVSCSKSFVQRKWTKEEAESMARNHYRNTYIPKEYIQ